MSKTRAPQPPRPRIVLGDLDPGALLELLDRRHEDDGGPDGSPYRRIYRASKVAFLKECGDDAVHFAALLDNVDAMTVVEDAIRHAGFIQGFECCRQLLLGELDLGALELDEAP